MTIKVGDTVNYVPLGCNNTECEVVEVDKFGDFTSLTLKDKEFGTIFEGVLLAEELSNPKQ